MLRHHDSVYDEHFISITSLYWGMAVCYHL